MEIFYCGCPLGESRLTRIIAKSAWSIVLMHASPAYNQ